MPQPTTAVEPSRLPILLGTLWLVATLIVLVVGFREAIFLVPTDAQQGNIGRAFYYHVPHSMLALLFPYLNFAASIAYLFLRRTKPAQALIADAWALAAAEITLVYTTICLVTGSLWGKAEWGIWWTWDERLTSMLLLWLLYVAYLLTRRLSSSGQSGDQTSTLAAVLSVFAAIDVPIVYMSIRWWRTQHPQPVFFGAPGSGMDKSMLPAFYWNILAFFMWGIFLLGFRFALERRRQAVAAFAIQSALHPSPTQGSYPRSLPEAGNAF